MEIYIAKKLFPDHLTVRGNLVAIDSITEAVLRHGTIGRYEIFIESAFLDAAEAFRKLREPGSPGDYPIHINSTFDIQGAWTGVL